MLFNQEVNKLCEMFIKNAYPTRFFNSIVNKFLCKSSVDVSDVSDSSETSEFAILKLPYFGLITEKFGRSISTVIKNKFDIEVRVVYSTFKVGSYFKLKSRTPLHIVSNVVYRFDCVRDAHTSYIGMTKRHLVTRCNEHIDFKCAQKSEVCTHILNCDACGKCTISPRHFSIIRNCRDETDCKLFEALNIKRLKPVLNKQLFAQGAAIMLKVFK